MVTRTPGSPAYSVRVRDYAVPLVSLVLSVPTLLGVVAFSVWAVYHALTGSVLDVSAPAALQSPPAFALTLLYVIFGPIAACALCLGQRARADAASGRPLAPGTAASRMNTLALRVAGAAALLLLALVFLGMVARGGT